MLWDLAGEKARQVYSAWNVAVKLTWDCPRETKTFLLQNILCCNLTSARTDILGRYTKFFFSLKNSAIYEVRVLANLTCRDVRTVTGKVRTGEGRIFPIGPKGKFVLGTRVWLYSVLLVSVIFQK